MELLKCLLSPMKLEITYPRLLDSPHTLHRQDERPRARLRSAGDLLGFSIMDSALFQCAWLAIQRMYRSLLDEHLCHPQVRVHNALCSEEIFVRDKGSSVHHGSLRISVLESAALKDRAECQKPNRVRIVAYKVAWRLLCQVKPPKHTNPQRASKLTMVTYRRPEYGQLLLQQHP